MNLKRLSQTPPCRPAPGVSWRTRGLSHHLLFYFTCSPTATLSSQSPFILLLVFLWTQRTRPNGVVFEDDGDDCEREGLKSLYPGPRWRVFQTGELSIRWSCFRDLSEFTYWAEASCPSNAVFMHTVSFYVTKKSDLVILSRLSTLSNIVTRTCVI